MCYVHSRCFMLHVKYMVLQFTFILPFTICECQCLADHPTTRYYMGREMFPIFINILYKPYPIHNRAGTHIAFLPLCIYHIPIIHVHITHL